MKKSLILFVCLIFFLAGCSSEGKQSNYKPLSEKQLSTFLAEKHLAPLAVRNVNQSTIILYETANEMGFYSISSNDRGDTSFSVVQMDNNSGYTPVSLSFVSGYYPFATMIINDSEIQRNGYKVEIELSSGDMIYKLVQGKKGLIIPAKKTSFNSLFMRYVTITDKNGKVLFKN